MEKTTADNKEINVKRKLILLPKYFWPATGGLQIASARIGATLANKGWQVSIYFSAEPNHNPNTYLENSLFNTVAVQGERKRFWKKLPALLNQVTHPYTTLAVGLEYEETVDTQITTLQMLRQTGTPTYLRVTTTNDIASRINSARASIVSQLDGLVVLNQEMEKEAENLGINKQLIHRIPVMVNSDRYRPNEVNYREVRISRGIQPDVPVILYAGRLDPRKRIELLIQAMAGVDALLWIVGDPTMGPDIKETERYVQLAHNYGLYSIKIDPQVPEIEMPPILQAADIFVTASRREGMSNAVLEATSAGLTVVGYDISGIREIAEAFNQVGFNLAHPDSGYLGLRKAILDAIKQYKINWRPSREHNLIAFSPQIIGNRWDLLLRGP